MSTGHWQEAGVATEVSSDNGMTNMTSIDEAGRIVF